ncbi:MAG TPA: Rrf2 family transcriptional regulator [Chryseosolibacter sp.]|nr:Rrf2 family transcriptional regulator [Chryseosolibacter sp.]
MFSKACEYAIRAMMYIVTHTSHGSKVGIKDIARYTDTPEPFVAKVLQILSRRGIVSSAKGPHGGFFIEAKSKLIPLIDIVKAIDGEDLFLRCGLGIKNCSERRPCPIHYEYKAIRENLKEMLQTNTIQDLASGLVKGETFLLKK